MANENGTGPAAEAAPASAGLAIALQADDTGTAEWLIALERDLAAHAAGAAGIVGVSLSESAHIWEPHVVEYFAIGTAITAVDPAAVRLEAVRPGAVLPLAG